MAASINILIVDQHPEEWSLRSLPAVAVTRCRGAEDALRKLHLHAFDVVAVGEHLDGGSGLKLLAEVRSKWPTIQRVVAFSADNASLATTLEAINAVRVHRMICRPLSAPKIRSAFEAIRARVVRERRHSDLMHRVIEQHSELATINRHLDDLVSQRTFDLLNGLLAALDYRDTETQWHSRRVGLYTHTMAWSMGFRDDELEDIHRGALLHDVGKIGIPDSIMLKPGKLDEGEWAVMRTHPVIGFDLLESIDFLERPRRTVLEHHERFDGRGYPHQLDGPEITMGARLFAIADTLDAMTSDRPYRKALPFSVAWDEIESQAGAQFDPQVVRAFQAIGREAWEAAVAVGQAHERGQQVPQEVVAVWERSAFVRGFGSIDPRRAWFQIKLQPAPTNPKDAQVAASGAGYRKAG